MLPIMKASTLFLLPLAYAAPTLPFPPPAELSQGVINANISLIAGGGLPNASGTTPQFSQAGITALQLLASLENIEAYYYAEAIHNLTTGVYTTGDLLLNDTLEVISKIAAVCFITCTRKSCSFNLLLHN